MDPQQDLQNWFQQRRSSCPGAIYGMTTSSTDGTPIANVNITLNWVQTAEGAQLKVGGNVALTSYTPRVTSTQAGEYVLPFYWADEMVPGTLASALAMLYYSDGSYTPNNQHGSVVVCPNFGKQLNDILKKVKPDSTSFSGASGQLLKFVYSASPELKAASFLTGFAGDASNPSTSYQGLACRIDFTFVTPPKVTAVGTQSG